MTLRIPYGAPVTVVHATAARAVLVHATVIGFDGDTLVVRLTEDAELPVGAQPIVQLPAGSAEPRAIVEVIAQEGRLLTCRLVRVPQKEAREYPRLQGLVDVRYRVATGDDAAAWLRGDDLPGQESVPDSFMNFSATGLAFDGAPASRASDLLLLSLSVPGDPTSWRCTARVLRVWPIPDDERDPEVAATHRTAVVFEAIPSGATAALTAYTLRIQDVMLRGID